MLLGYFVRPDVWVPIVLPVVKKHQHLGSILALANLIKGSELSKVEEFLPQICEVMSDPDVCTSGQVSFVTFYSFDLHLVSLNVLNCDMPLFAS